MALPEITQKSIEILQGRGEIAQFNPTAVGQVYEDERMRIACVMMPDGTQQGKWQPLELYIDLKLESGMRFPLGQNVPATRDMTRVFIWDRYEYKGDVPKFVRPGKWVDYIRRLHEDIEADLEQASRAHNKPIDDAGLFE